jgi:NADPH:quinone reductase-like Zn-dependent oxidoreductase
MTISVRATGYGGPEVLAVLDVPVGEPGPGEVRVAMRAAGVNPIDYKLYSGMLGSDPAALPMPLGLEGAGVIEAVGPDVGLAVGTEVVVYPASGTYAAALVVPADSVLPKPAGLSFEEAAGLLLVGATAVHAIDATQVARGDNLLVHGAAGGVGLAVVQLAVRRGARVIGTASEGNHALLRELGAEPIAYGDGLADRVRALAPGGVDAALDLVGGPEALQVSLALVADRARIATIANFAASAQGVAVLGGMGDQARLRAAARPELLRLAGEGTLKVRVAATYPLTDAAEAHRAIKQGHTVGKIVLTV